MKNSNWIIPAALGLALALPLSRAAADQTPAPADQKAMDKGGKLQKELGLTKDQAAKFQALKESFKSAMKPLNDKRRDLMTKLKSQVDAKAPDADLQSTLNDLDANHKAVMDQMMQMKTQMQSLLTPTQRAKMLVARKNHRRHHGSRHNGPAEGMPE
ncbi:MAG TPA: Spy/CpxP family protein refolding chaperone [Elusimicrobiota bacterium]|nr:Spy/CpxP family protein refolding chaperone [Elusimicrobiota bacterium]